MIRTVLFLITLCLAGAYRAQARTCNQIYDQGLKKVTFQIDSRILISPEHVARFPDLARQFGLAHISRDPQKNINALFSKLTLGLTDKNFISRSDEMARFGEMLLSLLPKDLSREKKKQVEYAVIEAVSKLESFTSKDVIVDDKVVFNRYPEFNYFQMNQFTTVTRNYLTSSPYFSSLIGHTGIIAWPDIRDIFSYQKWIVEIKRHDVLHLYYASGHPYYLPSVFRAAWSRNALRYYMVSSLFEGVDRFQTSFEQRIFEYMSAKPEFTMDGKIDLEAAIMYLARAPYVELHSIARELGLAAERDSILRDFQTWRPKLQGPQTVSQDSRDAELNGFIHEVQSLQKDQRYNQWILDYQHSILNLR